MAKRNGWITTTEGNHVLLKDGKIVDPPKNEKEKSPKGYDSRTDTPVKRAARKFNNISKYRKKLSSLTKDDWRIISEIGERIHRGFEGVAFQKGDTYLTMVNKKIVTLTGSYPYLVGTVFSFRSHNVQEKWFEYLKEL